MTTRPLHAARRAGRPARTPALLVAIFVALLAALAAVPRHAAAQGCTMPNNGTNTTCTGTLNVAMTVARTTRLVITSGYTDASSFSLFTSVGGADFTAGLVQGGSLSVTAKANAAATVTIAASQPKYTTPSTKNASDLLWSANGFTTAGAPLGTTGATVLPLPAATAGASATVAFRTVLSWTADPAAAYKLDVVIKISSP